jgi:hypothetical protein
MKVVVKICSLILREEDEIKIPENSKTGEVSKKTGIINMKQRTFLLMWVN